MMLKQVSYGGGCINDTIVHLATSHMPFGGVGNSGMGGYHGKDSFDTFTHKKSIMKKSDFRQFMTAKWVRFFWQADREQDLVWISQKEC